MRTSCTICGHGVLVQRVGEALENAGFDIAAVVRDRDQPGQMFDFPRMATIVVLEREGDVTIHSYTTGVSTTRSESTTKLKPRRGRPRKHALPVPTQETPESAQPPPTAAAQDDIPF